VNSCLDLDTGRCTFASRSNLDLGWCDITDDDVVAGDLKACFENFGENNIQNLYNELETLPESLSHSLNLLTGAYMSSNDMTTLPAGTFDSLQAMTLLYLGYNQLTTLPAGMFGSLPALTTLGLTNNELTTLPAGMFDSLTALTELDLSFNQLTTLPAGMFGSGSQLTLMDVSYNSLSTLPVGVFDHLILLTELNLPFNDLTTLPAGIFDSLTALTKLRLNNNDLTTLPAGTFGALPALTELDLSDNDLTTLPVEIFDSLPAVTVVDLSGNELATLPAGILDSVNQLIYINLGYNDLTTLPAGIFDSLPAMRTLELRDNDLMMLPEGIFDSLPDLNYLYINSNSLTTLPAGIFESLEALETLWLHDNTDLECLPTLPSTNTYVQVDDEIGKECGCEFGEFSNPCSEQELQCAPGPVGYTCAVPVTCDPNNDNSDCETDQVCCDDRLVCVDRDDEFLYNPTACGDPHMFGFSGQKFDFTGEDGAWYSLIADDNMHINMRVTSPVPDLPEITYITGLSILATDENGVHHTVVIEVREPQNLDSSCPAGLSPCLADGSLSVLLDGEEELLAPGTVSLGRDVQVSAANLPGACRSFGFEKYWERKRLENARHGRRLSTTMGMGEWILGDPTATNMDECIEYVARAEVEEGGVFTHQSEHASFQIVTPKATVRLSHGRLHQIAMRDPTDKYDLPDHLTWQMNMAVDHNEVSRSAKGILGETFIPTRDVNGKQIMAGMEAIRGQQEHYRVEGALGTDFVQDGRV
ncbi:unnamed protein product, partial [Ectocarpus sp. 6 AP-2014]